MLLRTIKNYTLLRIYKTARFLKTGKFKSVKRSKKERTLQKIIGGVLNDPKSRVYYSPESYRIFTHNQDKTYIISFDDREIRITNHRFFSSFQVNPDFARSIIREAFARIERDMQSLESESVCNEDFFLNEVYDKLSSSGTNEEIPTKETEKYFEDILNESTLS